MKKIHVLFCASAITFLTAGIYFYKASPTQYNEENETNRNIEAPYENMLMQRTYPYSTFDFVAYQHALQIAAVASENGSRSNNSWITEGPGNIGGRFNCTAVHPTNNNIIYAGAATGGLFKTTNGGNTWNSIFDAQPFLSIGCITIDNNNPNIIWVGTGDVNISGNCFIGDGVYKSTDGGNTWTNMGLNDCKIFSKIIIDPTNSNIVYAAAMGQPFLRDNNRGLYKSIDGGATWNNILFISNQAGIIDLLMDTTNTQILYAASYPRIRNEYEAVSSGTESKIWKSIDGGTTWNVLTNGLPNYAVGRIGLAMSATNTNKLYAIVADTYGMLDGIYKTTNAGNTWSAIDISSLFPSSYCWYFGKIYVNPGNDNQIYVLDVDLYTTLDDGNTWSLAAPDWFLYDVHADKHFMSFIDADNIILSTDGGLYRTTNNCGSWNDIENIPVNQVYHSNENPFVTNDYWCGVQDNGTSNGNAANINNWIRVYGGDGFQSYIDPIDANIVYASTQNGGIVFSDDGGVNFTDCTTGINGSDERNWDMPYSISKADHTNLYCGTNRVYKMTGAPYGNWNSISSILTNPLDTNLDDIHTITTISESPLSSNVIYAGTGDANVWFTNNGGTSWNNITDTLPNRYVTCVKASPNITGNVYVSHSGYRSGDNIPHIHKSTNYGSSWTDISGNLPPIAVNDILVFEGNEAIIFVATDAGVYSTVDGGINWNRVGNNMPMMPVLEIEFNNDKTKLIAATYARSVQTIDITDIITGTNTQIAKNDIIIYQNPITDYLKININYKSKTTYCIYNLSGEIIAKGNSIDSNEILISTLNWTKGTYIIRIENASEKTSRKLVKI